MAGASSVPINKPMEMLPCNADSNVYVVPGLRVHTHNKTPESARGGRVKRNAANLTAAAPEHQHRASGIYRLAVEAKLHPHRPELDPKDDNADGHIK